MTEARAISDVQTPRCWERAVRRIARSSVGFVCLSAVFVASGSGQRLEDPPPGASGSRVVRVMAAASLLHVLPEIADAAPSLSRLDPRFTFDGSSRLARQVSEGATADLYVAADRAWIDWLEARELLEPGTIRRIAGGELVLVVPTSSATVVGGPNDLLGLTRIAIAGENVPAGRYAEEALRTLGVWNEIEGRVVRGSNVRSTLEWVARSEIDAGLVYRSDTVGDSRVRVAYAFPDSTHTPIGYFAAGLRSRVASREDVDALLDALVGEAAAEIWTRAGFTPEGTEIPGSDRTQLAVELAPNASTDLRSAIVRTLWVGLLAVLLGSVPAIGLGWLLARRTFPGKVIVSTLTHAPLVLPPVVTGFLLLALLGANGPLDPILSRWGWSIPFTFLGAVLAAFIVGFPLFVASVRAAFEAVDPRYEEMAQTLGAAPRRSFLRVSLPLAFPGIAAGAVLAFARALGEFGATIVLAGNIEGETRTISLAIYSLLESPDGWSGVWILVGASVLLSLVAMAGFETLNGWQRRRLEIDHG